MRYRMLDVRIWCDEKFRALSGLKPSAQALFIYLLTNPHTTSIPGLYRAGAAAMSEELGWSLLSFNRALKEVVEQGLVRVDLKARVIFIANAIKYNKPQSPNVVKSWSLHWDEIPECGLKNEAYEFLKGFVEGLGKAFGQAFEESLGKAQSKKRNFVGQALGNQEQKQSIKKSALHRVGYESGWKKPVSGGNYILTAAHNSTVTLDWLNRMTPEKDHFFVLPPDGFENEYE
jgi:hypothetical protein